MDRRIIVCTLALVVGCGNGDFDDGASHRCSPDEPICPDGYICCSDDPAAIHLDDLDAMVLPQYLGGGGTGTPIFSGGNNSLSTSGLCIEAGAVPIEGALSDFGAQGCPIPCNPQWENADIEVVCGDNTLCCQMLELEPEDCVLDPSLGDAGCHRPVTGMDISGLGGLDATEWTGTEHATHQDPDGTNCKTFVAGVPEAVLADKGITAEDLQRACFRRLAVADTRGFCLAESGSVTGCPLDEPDYYDACELLNQAESRTGCD